MRILPGFKGFYASNASNVLAQTMLGSTGSPFGTFNPVVVAERLNWLRNGNNPNPSHLSDAANSVVSHLSPSNKSPERHMVMAAKSTLAIGGVEQGQDGLDQDWDREYDLIQNRVFYYLKTRQFTNCLYYLDQCSELVFGDYSELNRPALQIRLLRAKTYFESGQLQNANDECESIHAQYGYESMLTNFEHVDFLLMYASVQFCLSLSDSEIENSLRKANRIVLESKDPALAAIYSKYMIAFVNECFRHDFIPLGYTWIDEAVDTAKWCFGSQSIEYADALIERSRIHSDFCDDKSASVHDAETAIEVLFSMHSTDNSNLALTRLVSLGQKFNDAKKDDLAVRCFTRATEFTRRSNVSHTQHRVIGDLNLARIYFNRGDLSMSLHHLVEALHILDQQGLMLEEIRINVLQDLQKIYEATADHFNAQRVREELSRIRQLLNYVSKQTKSEA